MLERKRDAKRFNDLPLWIRICLNIIIFLMGIISDNLIPKGYEVGMVIIRHPLKTDLKVVEDNEPKA